MCLCVCGWGGWGCGQPAQQGTATAQHAAAVQRFAAPRWRLPHAGVCGTAHLGQLYVFFRQRRISLCLGGCQLLRCSGRDRCEGCATPAGLHEHGTLDSVGLLSAGATQIVNLHQAPPQSHAPRAPALASSIAAWAACSASSILTHRVASALLWGHTRGMHDLATCQLHDRFCHENTQGKAAPVAAPPLLHRTSPPSVTSPAPLQPETLHVVRCPMHQPARGCPWPAWSRLPAAPAGP